MAPLLNPPSSPAPAPSQPSTDPLAHTNPRSTPPASTPHHLPPTLTRKLYTSHLLSTYNSRTYQFATILFLASTFPTTLLPLSIYALICSFSAIILAPAIGRAVDKRGRLGVVRFSIGAARTAVIVSCVCFWALYRYRVALPAVGKWAIFGVVTLLACVEKPCSVLNLVAVERDWAVVIAEEDERVLQTLNARMRRIDLFCKLAGPLVIALIDGASTESAIWLVLGMNALCLPIEYFAISQVYNAVPLLQIPKTSTATIATPDTPQRSPSLFSRMLLSPISTFYTPLKFYYRHPVFLPSLALSLLYLTVLSLSGQMLTYLLSSGYNAFHIATVRTLSVFFELCATWIAPRLMRRVHPARVGMWFLSWQMLWLGAAVTFFWVERLPIVAASGLVAGTILSRVGLWGFDLFVQFIVQEEVQGDQRGSFSSTEASLQNAFEMLSYVTTLVWSRPRDFRCPVLISVIVAYVAGALYGRFLRERRGHLLHAPVCIKR